MSPYATIRRLPSVILLILVTCPLPAHAAQYTRLVNPFTGTGAGGGDFGTGGGAGNTFPGAVAPFGMLACSARSASTRRFPGTDVLVLGSPLFRRAEVATGAGGLTVLGRRARRHRPYVERLTVDGLDYDRPWLRARDFGRDATLRFELADAPTAWGARPDGAPPSFAPDAVATCDAP